MEALTWYATSALLLRILTEFVMQREVVPQVPPGRLLTVCFWRAFGEVPFPVSIVMLCDPESPLDIGLVIFMLMMAAITLILAWRGLLVAKQMKGSLVKTGELHDAIFAMAKQMRAPLRRLYIRPEAAWPQPLPLVSARGELMIPEGLVRNASRRELDGLVGYGLMLVKNDYIKSLVLSIAPMAALVLWRAYMYQHSTSGNLTLIREAGVVFSASVAFNKSLRRVRLDAETAFKRAGGDGEGWIAGIARAGRMAGSPQPAELIQRIAKAYEIPPQRVEELVEKGLPESGSYVMPEFSPSRLILIS